MRRNIIDVFVKLYLTDMRDLLNHSLFGNFLSLVFWFSLYFVPYAAFIDDDDPEILAYLTIIPSSILGLCSLSLVFRYFTPIVLEFEVDSIPMEDMSRKGDMKLEVSINV
ncbi:hypothetical protein SOMG_03992 [Schizosaccharomyces osmophilus]|uniref:Uncharacterized protein n=1 Tax=Schizosaccharomyces osmophilus TaxID=2545709 RepID=A0AAE9WDI6_9SCHI|nr:uncharacterized protein SOMG_03992 [Schizosaccharomyces osmophilus]WBW73599.1 hypothetical protein SOMG_03992 [Schizosaccharomyces osmophilus]